MPRKKSGIKVRPSYEKKPHLAMIRRVAENMSGLTGKDHDRAVEKSLRDQQEGLTTLLGSRLRGRARKRRSKIRASYDRNLPDYLASAKKAFRLGTRSRRKKGT